MNDILPEKFKGEIFIIDDELPNIRALSDMLKNQGYDVRGVRDGNTALTMIHAEQPDIILLDIRMPELNGYEVCSRLKRHKKTRNIPIIFISALNDLSDKIKAFKTGGVDYITKPFQEEEVLMRVQTHLELHRMRKNLQEMVESRTADLVRSNENMERELIQRRQVEARLLRLSVAIEYAAEDIIITNKDGIIEYVNPAFERVTGYSSEEAIGKTPQILKSGRHSNEFYQNLWRTILSGRVWSGRLTNRGKNGVIIEQDANIAPIADASGNISGFVSVKRDVTENEKLKAQLLHAQKMEAIGTLASGIAHDFNNILGGIIGFTELAKEEMEEFPDQSTRMQKYLSRILEAGNRAANLVQQILRFSRQEQTVQGAFQMKPICKEVVKLLRAALPQTIKITERIAADRDIIVGDPTQIHQVIMNICTNAYHAMREKGGDLSLDLENVELRGIKQFHAMKIPAGFYVKLSITDTGSGVPQEIQNRIFDPYFTTKKAGEGTGLGLSVSSGIIQNHQGLIDLESAPDQGAVFSVYLPVAEKPRHVAITDEQNIPKGQGEKILFIDDELFFLEAMEEQLNSLGYQVMAVQSSLNALEIIKSAPHGFDLIITDQTMPDMTGVQLSAEIHRLNLQIPIILCTGFSETITEQTARDYGISKFLMKPVNRGDLAKAVYEVLG